MFTAIVKRLAKDPVVHRSFSTCHPALNAQKSPLFQLRQKTGLAYNLCREALNKHNNDVEQAEIWLQAQALAHGLQKATKVGSRATKEGLISLAVGRDNKSLTMLELNCETDFVAKNQTFREFAVDLTEDIVNSRDGFTAHQTHADTKIHEFVADAAKLEGISKKIAPLLTKLGENIKIHKLIHFRSTCNNINLYGHIHAQAGQKKSDNFDILAGRFGAMIGLNCNAEAPAKSVGNILCHHVIGYNPTYIELPEELRKKLEEAEKEKAQLDDQPKSEPAEGEDADDRDPDELRLDNGNSRDDWPSIMDQQLIMTDNQTVRDFCKENQISIVYFKRFECGIDSCD